jgi:hypothetical protein
MKTAKNSRKYRENGKGRAKANLGSLFATLRAGGWEPGRITGWSPAETERNYNILIGSRTSWKNLPLVCVAAELLAVHNPDTVRGNMYLLVSHGWLPDTGKRSYRVIQRLLNRLRLRGTIKFEWVVDNVRSTIKPSSWSGLEDFAETCREAYRKSFWPHMPDYIEVIVEKDTVAGKVAPVTREYDVALHPLRGYSSTSFAWGIVKGWERISKPITIYYIGDHDPSGRDLEREIQQKIKRISKGREFTWKRLAVNPEQFDEFNIIPLKPKKGDKRWPKFEKQFGWECAEVEAIPASDLRAMVRQAIESHIPQGQWQRLQEIERLEREQWQEAMGRLQAGIDNNDDDDDDD